MIFKHCPRAQLLTMSFLLIFGITGILTGCGDKIAADAETKASNLRIRTGSDDYSLIAVNNRNYSSDNIPEHMTVAEKKERFSFLVAPAVEAVHAELMNEFYRAAKAIDTGQDQELELLKAHYQVQTNQKLLQILKPHPKSIAMAQAAMESAWGTSRFFQQANNIFGVWSFNENEPRIAASEQRGAQTVWVKKYSSLNSSIRDYFRVIARGHAFGEFQELKMTTDDPYLLVQKLDHYSEKGAQYGEELAAMIRFNNFQKYD